MCPINWTMAALLTAWNETRNTWDEVALCLPPNGMGAAFIERKHRPVAVPLENVIIAGKRYWIFREKQEVENGNEENIYRR